MCAKLCKSCAKYAKDSCETFLLTHTKLKEREQGLITTEQRIYDMSQFWSHRPLHNNCSTALLQGKLIYFAKILISR